MCACGGLRKTLISTVDEIKYEVYSRLSKNVYFVCNQCYLRGSILSDDWSYSSDVDILVVSNDFYDLTMLKRKELVENLFCDLHINIDVICLSSGEYYELTKAGRIELFEGEFLKII